MGLVTRDQFAAWLAAGLVGFGMVATGKVHASVLIAGLVGSALGSIVSGNPYIGGICAISGSLVASTLFPGETHACPKAKRSTDN